MTAAQAWSPWYVAAWVVWGLVFAALEAGGLLHSDDAYPPLTHVVHRYVPGVLTITGVVWLLWHALAVYGVIA